MTDRVLSMIGIAKKAGKVCSGTFLSEDAIKNFVVNNCVIYNQDAVDATLSRDEGSFHIVPGVQGAVVDENEVGLVHLGPFWGAEGKALGVR